MRKAEDEEKVRLERISKQEIELQKALLKQKEMELLHNAELAKFEEKRRMDEL